MFIACDNNPSHEREPDLPETWLLYVGGLIGAANGASGLPVFPRDDTVMIWGDLPSVAITSPDDGFTEGTAAIRLGGDGNWGIAAFIFNSAGRASSDSFDLQFRKRRSGTGTIGVQVQLGTTELPVGHPDLWRHHLTEFRQAQTEWELVTIPLGSVNPSFDISIVTFGWQDTYRTGDAIAFIDDVRLVARGN